jgi:hypothetical protein
MVGRSGLPSGAAGNSRHAIPCSTMPHDYTLFLWLLKLGAVVNFYFLWNVYQLPVGQADPHLIVPAQILFAVAGYRCLFPNRYKDNVVLHASVMSSTLVTRVLATFAEVAWIYQFSHVIRLLNLEQLAWVDALSWLMVVAVTISQLFVWGAIATGRLSLYFYEEFGWLVIFVANTIASTYLLLAVDGLGTRETLLQFNLLFGAVYLPWQLIHLSALRADAAQSADATQVARLTQEPVKRRLYRSLHERKRATDADSWGGPIGLTWMTAYWATLIPIWLHQIVEIAATPWP